MRNASAAADLTSEQCQSLRYLAGLMIPASAAFNVPSAADDAIFAEIIAGIGQDRAHVLAVLRTLDAMAGGRFLDLDDARRRDVAAQLRDAGGVALFYVSRIILQCYYRDDRVVTSLGMELRPPFPKGFEVEQGDWSLLEPVRARKPFYRPVPADAKRSPEPQ